MKKLSGILFDLDGTLLDTAPDLIAAANKMLLDRHQPTLNAEILRPLASSGARGFIEKCFNISIDHPDFEALKQEFFANYEANPFVHSTFFPGIKKILNDLNQRAIPWGIVTNKITRFTAPITQHFGLTQQTSCIVSGDTTDYAKPHPAPLFYAAKLLNIAPEELVYIGDDLRDIKAGQAADMTTIAATYGYCNEASPSEKWNADYLVKNPEELHALLQHLTL